MANNYQSAPWGFSQYGQVNQPITSSPGRLPNPIGEEGYKLLKSKGGTELNFLIKQEDLLRALCNHRHGGNFDVCQDPELPGLFRCNICGEQIDLKTQYDPAFVKKVIDFLWAIFNSLKTNNNGVISNVVMSDLATGMLMIKHIPKMLTAVNGNLERNLINQQSYQQQYYRTPNMQTMINTIVNGGHDYVSQYQPGSEQYWRQPQNIIEAQQAFNAAQAQSQYQAAPVVYPQGQVVYQPIPFAAGSGQGQVVYQPQPAQVPYDGTYSQGAPPPGVPVYPQQPQQAAQPQYQPAQYQTAPQVPPQAASSVVPEVQPPQPAPPNQQAPTMNKVFKR